MSQYKSEYTLLMEKLRKSNEKETVNRVEIDMNEYDFGFKVDGNFSCRFLNGTIELSEPSFFLKKDKTQIVMIDRYLTEFFPLDKEKEILVKKMETIMHAFYYNADVYKFNSVEDLNDLKGIFIPEISSVLVDGTFYNIKKA